jgi:septum formation protein
VQAPHVPEQRQDTEPAVEYAMRLAREKAEAVWQGLNDISQAEGLCATPLVLGADTVVVLDEHVLEKPQDAEDAVRMLRLLRGKTHEVTTGVCLIGSTADGRWSIANGSSVLTRRWSAHQPADQSAISTTYQPSTVDHRPSTACDVRYATTRVTFDELTDQEIREYIATGESMDKAGAYAIQGIASRWVSRLEGDYFNVMGLPVALVWRMLRNPSAVSTQHSA